MKKKSATVIKRNDDSVELIGTGLEVEEEEMESVEL